MEKYLFPALFVMAQAILLLVQLLKNKKANERAVVARQTFYKYNPHPPGEAQACKDHKIALSKLGEKQEEQGKAIARVEENQEAQEKRLDRIEGKINGMR